VYTSTPAPTGGIVADDSGFIGFQSLNIGGALTFVYSTDRGDTWHSTKIFEPYGINAPILIVAGTSLDRSTHTLNTLWVSQDNFAVYEAESHDLGATWSEPHRISDTCPDPENCDQGNSTVFPWISARNGKTAIAWYEADRSKLAKPTNPNNVAADVTWKVMYSERATPDSEFSAPAVASMVKKPDGSYVPAAVYKGAVCTGGITTCTIDNRLLGDFMQIALRLDGKAVISYANWLGQTGLYVAVQQ
jgi:hypothetical protein